MKYTRGNASVRHGTRRTPLGKLTAQLRLERGISHREVVEALGGICTQRKCQQCEATPKTLTADHARILLLLGAKPQAILDALIATGNEGAQRDVETVRVFRQREREEKRREAS